ncbi:MAG: glycosyltransferase family 4 protein [Phycisphaerales bacterium]
MADAEAGLAVASHSAEPRRILLATDAWLPQVNGVVRCWQNVIAELERRGHAVEVLHPGLFRTVAAPRYPEIRLALMPGRGCRCRAEAFAPDAVHIATEGPVGAAVRRWCLRTGRAFTTSYHTQFPMYLKRYFGIPERISWAFVRRFHRRGAATLVPTESVRRELVQHGIEAARTWSRGVDAAIFRPGPWSDPSLASDPFEGWPRPILLYAGRVAVEKNIEAFTALKTPGTKVVVGDGPARASLERRHPEVRFLGYRFGEALGRHYAAADVLVFPSLTDTFGVVMIEANACGTPVAAFPVTGPIDVVRPGENGWLDEDLDMAAAKALGIPRERCLAFAATQTWTRTADLLLEALVWAGGSNPGSAPTT